MEISANQGSFLGAFHIEHHVLLGFLLGLGLWKPTWTPTMELNQEPATVSIRVKRNEKFSRKLEMYRDVWSAGE